MAFFRLKGLVRDTLLVDSLVSKDGISCVSGVLEPVFGAFVKLVGGMFFKVLV